MSKYDKKRNIYGSSRASYIVRRYFMYLVVFIVIVIGVVAATSLSGSSEESEDKETLSNVVLEEGDYYPLAMYEPKTFNVLSSKDEDVVYINQLIYSYLFKLDDTLNIVPDIVSDYSTNTSRGSVDIILRNDIRFSDGTSLDSYDVSFTIAAIKGLGSNSPYYSYVSRIKSCEIVSDDELVITFSDPREAALDNLVFPIVSSSGYRNNEEFISGSGEYMYSDYIQGKSIKLVPNEKYHGNIPLYPVEISIIKDKSSAPGLVTMDAVMAYLSKDTGMDSVAEDKSIRSMDIVSGELEYIGFNCNKTVLNESTMRQAIAFAINRGEIISDDYGNSAVISDSLYYPGFLGTDPTDDFSYDPKTASNLFQSLGLRDVDEDGILENADNEDILLKMIVNAEITDRRNAARTISNHLGQLGIKIDLHELSEAEFNSALAYGDFDIYIAGINIDKQFNLKELYGTANYGGYRGAEVMELTYDLEMVHNAEELTNLFNRLKSLLYNEMPYFGICYKTYSFISTDTLSLKEIPLYFDPYRNISEWRWKKRVSTS